MIKDDLAEAVRAALLALDVDPVPDDINLQRPARREHGDWSANVALTLAKTTGRNPRELATEMAQRLTDDAPPHVTAVEVAGPEGSQLQQFSDQGRLKVKSSLLLCRIAHSVLTIARLVESQMFSQQRRKYGARDISAAILLP